MYEPSLRGLFNSLLQKTCANPRIMLSWLLLSCKAPSPTATSAFSNKIQAVIFPISMSLILLSVLAFFTGLFHIRAEYYGPQRAIYFLKPLTTTLILLIALLTPQPISFFYKAAISLGLLFSLVGDICLMLPADRFVLGLASFLLAHLCYIAAFATRSGFHATWWLLIPFLVDAAIMLRLLWPYVGQLKAPVLIYLLVILTMGWQAAEQWQRVEQAGVGLALLGALLFIISDSTLALDRFRKPFPSAHALVLGTYYIAQWLIALSIRQQ